MSKAKQISFLIILCCITLPHSGCGYTTTSALAPHLKTVYVKPFANKIDIASLNTNTSRLPIYRHGMEVDITNSVIDRYQFTGVLRPATSDNADSWLEGELVEFRRDALRFNDSGQVEEWRINIVVNLRYTDKVTGVVMWEEPRYTGDTTYFAIGADSESEATARDRAITDLARRIVERTVENW